MMSDSMTPPNPIPTRTSSIGPANGTTNGGHRNGVLKTVPASGAQRPRKPGHERTMSTAADGASFGGGGWSPEKEGILLGPYDYMVQQPGKDIRKQLISAFNRWLQVPEESLTIVTRIVVMLHTASLLVDDVEDSSNLRRGVPVAHNIFGTAQTINSANYIYFLALEEIQKLKNPDAIQIYTKELLNLHRGQGMDLFWRDTLTCPSEEDYLEMVGNKTGGLFRLAVKLMQAESKSTVDCIPLVNLMGPIFQICDDYLNLSNPIYSRNKGLCEDLTEGKFSFPVIHSVRSQPDNLQLINILKQRTKEEEVKRYAISYMESTGSFAYTRKIVAKLRDKALAEIEKVEASLDRNSGENSGENSSENSSEGSGDMVRSIIEKIVQPTLQTDKIQV